MEHKPTTGMSLSTGSSRLGRRQFLRLCGLGGGALLAGCNNDERPLAPDIPPRSEWMDPGSLQSRMTTVNDISMHALISVDAAPPDAPPLVLVHGSGLSGQYMIPTARMLTPYFPIYVPDIPGYGASGDPGKILNVEEMADWLVDWMDAIRLPRASFLGNSFGCQVIVELAARYPEYTERLLLQGPTTPPEERSAFRQFTRWRQNEPYNPMWLGDVTQEDYDRAGALRLIQSYIYQVRDPIEKKAPRIQAPTLIMRGEHDPVAYQEFCEELAQLFPRGELVLVPDVAHTLVFTAPEALTKATREFMAREVSS
ncbi:alpha/beta fold hydrolase [Marinimicrobium sp. ABcell2]|uniref:alpha/beta fold hydrolase n=1 Tax=Marinimicrobium sp. ABcell2 TaxID=3069751 RepID=UPI0027B60D4D|nr:alpha/beta hydrolase [Marinimicrobium sp. ABcell2]MDQ2076636.1 alpha/beta hydrolase [Marinimicrobium sp. ABcell2]